MCNNLSIPAISRWAWFTDFLRRGGFFGVYEMFNDGVGTIMNESLASFWSSSRKSTNFWFAGLKTSFWNLRSAFAIDWGFSISWGNLPGFLSDSLGLGHWCLQMSVAYLHSWEKMNSEVRLEQSFKQLKFFRFPLESWYRCREWLRQFGNSVFIVREICRVVVVWPTKFGLLQPSQGYSH